MVLEPLVQTLGLYGPGRVRIGKFVVVDFDRENLGKNREIRAKSPNLWENFEF
jgi:hypothetical protein